eukprot:12323701-Alexandrium_andersonii.AAC.1
MRSGPLSTARKPMFAGRSRWKRRNLRLTPVHRQLTCRRPSSSRRCSKLRCARPQRRRRLACLYLNVDPM